MILFYAEHNGVMSNYISMRFKLHSQDKVVLMMHQAPPKEICDRLVKNGVFDMIVDVPIHVTPKMTFKANTPEGVEKEIVTFYDKLFEEKNIKLEDVKKIYYANDTVSCFALYMCIKKIKFNYVEIVKRQIDIIEQRYNCGGLVMPAFLDKMKEYDTLIKNPAEFQFLDKYYIFPQSDIPSGFEDKVVIFDFLEMMNSLEDVEYRKIIRSFDISNYMQIVTPNIAVMATLGTGRLGALIGKIPMNKQAVIFQLMMDYYLPNNVKIISKSHPRRPMKLIICDGEVEEIPNWFPIEYIVYYKNIQVEYLVLADDGLTEKLIGRFEGKIICPQDAFYRNQFYLMLNRYYAALNIYQHFADYELKIAGINKEAFMCFVQNVGNPNKSIGTISGTEIGKNQFAIISPSRLGRDVDVNSMLLEADDNSIIVFADVLNRFVGYSISNPELLNNFIAIKIEKSNIFDESKCILDTCTEYIFVYSKSLEIRKKIKEMTECKRNLNHAGIRIKISAVEEWENRSILQEVRIKVLEQMICQDHDRIGEITKCVLWDNTISPLNLDKNLFSN